MYSDLKSVLEKDKMLAFVPGGNSMWPTLKNRKQSVVIVEKQGRLKELDIALFLMKNKYCLHRVIKVTETGYLCRGDGRYTGEEVLEEQVIGFVEGFYKGKKYVSTKDEKYILKSKKWVNSKIKRPFLIRIYTIKQKIKWLLLKIFKPNRKEVDDD